MEISLSTLNILIFGFKLISCCPGTKWPFRYVDLICMKPTEPSLSSAVFFFTSQATRLLLSNRKKQMFIMVCWSNQCIKYTMCVDTCVICLRLDSFATREDKNKEVAGAFGLQLLRFLRCCWILVYLSWVFGYPLNRETQSDNIRIRQLPVVSVFTWFLGSHGWSVVK